MSGSWSDDGSLTPKDWRPVDRDDTRPSRQVAVQMNSKLWRWWNAMAPEDATAYVVEMTDGSRTLLADLPPRRMFLISDLN